MSANYKKLGEIVELIDERNKDGKVQNLIGVSIDKCFIKSVANTIGTDLTKYQVIRKNDFACSLMFGVAAKSINVLFSYVKPAIKVHIWFNAS